MKCSLFIKKAYLLLIVIFPLYSMQLRAATGSMTIAETSVPDLSVNASGAGWIWTAGTATISLTDTYTGKSIAINCLSTDVVNLSYMGNISISSNSADAIYCNGSLNIEGANGTLSFAYTGSNYMFSAITTMEFLTVSSGNTNITCSASSRTSDNFIIGNAAAVYARRGFNITGNSNVTINVTGSNTHGIYTEEGDPTISTTGAVTTNATGIGYPLDITNEHYLTISNGTVNLSNNDTPGNMIWSKRSDFGFKMTGGVIKYNNGIPPVLTSLAPNSGTAAGGTVVTLTGTGLSGDQTKVKVGDTDASVTDGNTTQIQFTTPQGNIGATNVLVQGTGGVSVFKDVFTYTNGTGIEDEIVQNSRVYAQGKNIIIKNVEPGNYLTITDITGKIVAYIITKNPETSISVATSGMYVVRVCGQTTKVICK